MKIINVDANNIDQEHICCAISDKKGESCVSSKKAWLKARFEAGLVFKKLDVRGKVFIEYIPAENAWCPIIAPDYIYIDCFWVSGQFKGQGWANQLLAACIEDAQRHNKKGLVTLSSTKKMPFLSDPAYLKHKGFKTCDTAAPYYELLYLPFNEAATPPQFKPCCKLGTIAQQEMVLYYSNQCPHTEKYAPIIQKIAKDRGQSLTLIPFTTAEAAQNAPAPFTTYSFFDRGVFITNEILSEKKFNLYLDKRG